MDRIIAARAGANGHHATHEGDLALLDELCDTMFNGSLCGLGGLTPFPVRSAVKHFREDFQRAN
jgi:NADH:ubiquinone oxidoreductase subunit F (NADH-binding)